MANVKTFISPQDLLDYMNVLTLPGAFPTAWEVIDKGSRYTVIEETPFKITTLFDENALAAYLITIVGTLKKVVPKKEGGMLTYYSLTDEVLGANNGFILTISNSAQQLEDDLNALIGGGATETHVIEHGYKTLILSR